jgi:hypothetical protein
LSSAIFSGLATDAGGQLSASAFAVGAATGAAPQIVFDTTTGALSYDSNGAEAGGATQFATLTNSTGTIDNHSFWVVWSTGGRIGYDLHASRIPRDASP